MMASNLISRLLPPRAGSPSVYETLERHDESEHSDLEERAGMALDEANLGDGSDDYDLGRIEGAVLDESQMTTDSTALLGGDHMSLPRSPHGRSTRRPKWMTQSRRVPEQDEGDDEVPLSLLTEGVVTVPEATGTDELAQVSSHVPRPSSPQETTQWRPSNPPRKVQRDDRGAVPARRKLHRGKPGLAMIDPKERALWRWANVENLDNFLKDVYDYFLGNGIWCIMLSRVLNLL